MDRIEVFKNDLWMLLLSTLRYSMGRMSYMPSYCVEMIKNYSKGLEDHQVEQIKREVLEELRIEKVNPGHLGMECDVSNWARFVIWLEDEADERLHKN